MITRNNTFHTRFLRTAGNLSAVLFLVLFTTGCGEKNALTDAVTAPPEAQEESAGLPGAARTETPPAESVKAAEETTEAETEETAAPDAAGASLAKRLCGKYSCKTSDTEYSILEIVEFADNLYAFGGDAMDEELELDAYSFWAMELLPEDAAVLSSADADSCNVGVLTFSIMSNLGRYWSAPRHETIRIKEDGVIFNGDHYLRDERVRDTFPYIAPDRDISTLSRELDGLWRERGASAPHYLRFADGFLTIYQKTADQEVFYGRGGYETAGNIFRCTYNTLGNGTMPAYMEAAFSVGSDGLLTLDPVVDDIELFDPGTVFEPIPETAVPIITLSDAYQAGLTEDREYVMFDLPPEIDDNPFYGVWISAYPDKEDAEKDLEGLGALDLPACVILSTDWENLSSTPYYCVTAGRFDSELDANTILERVRSAGYTNAYVKYTGEWIGTNP